MSFDLTSIFQKEKIEKFFERFYKAGFYKDFTNFIFSLK